MNFVFLSLQRINTDRESTSTGLAKELSNQQHKVLYVNPPINRKTWFASDNDKFINEHIREIKDQKDGLIEISPNLYRLNTHCILESINWIPNTMIFSVVNKINNKRLAREILKSTQKLDMDNFILINDKDMFNSFYLKELLKPKAYIYLDRDKTVVMDYWKRHGTKLEPKLIRKSDAVICNSYDFEKYNRQFNQDSYYIGNGVDLGLFDVKNQYEIPNELKNIPKPVIGYVGALLSLRLDIDLMFSSAVNNPDKSFVFIGPEDDDFAKSKLHELENVYFLGKRHKNIVPAYINYFDVCINPQIVNEVTIGNFPLKIVEYLSLGKPVVAIETNTMNELFPEVTYIAKNQPEFDRLIDKAIREDSDEKRERRVNFTKQFSWNKVANNVLAVIKKIENRK